MTEKKINPFSIMPPDTKWVSTTNELRELGYNFLLPPLVHKIREAVFDLLISYLITFRYFI